MRAHDWSATPLGPPDGWPPLLKSTLRIVLSSNHPMFVWWGPELIQFYNTAYRQTLGPERHPAALGQPGRDCWQEIWHIIEPQINLVMVEGESTWHEDSQMPITRHGRREDIWWTYGYSPLRDEQAIHGVLVVCNEVTAQHIAQRRQHFLLELADRLRPLSSPESIVATASELLGQRLGVSRVLFSEIDELAGKFFIRRDWTQSGIDSVAGKSGRLEEFGADLINASRRGEIVATEDVLKDPNAELQAYAAVNVRSHVLIPLIKNGVLVVALALHQPHPYSWTTADLQMAGDMAERAWAAVEAVRALAELNVERDRSAYVLQTMADGFALVDGDWNILQMNAEGLRLIQRSREEVIGCNHWAVFPELVGTPLAAVYEEVKRTGVAQTAEVDYRYANIGVDWVEITTHPAKDGGLAFFFRDVSKRKAAEEKVKDMDRRKDEFLAMLAHELRNPLAPIRTAAELLLRGADKPALVNKASGVISRQVGHLTSLIDDLMDVSRVTRGLVTLNQEVLDARQIASEAVEQSRPLLDSRRHCLQVSVSPEPAPVFGDAKRLVQVLANLLNNAAKYTPEGGVVALELHTVDGQVVSRVTDNGVGMTPDLVGRVFDLFVQAERTSDRHEGGLGIGLALVKSLVELHRGTVSACSAGLGLGSKFTICLPINATPQDQLLPQENSLMPSQGRRLRLLVVDDNVDAAHMLAMVLESMGHTVAVENSSHAALARVQIEKPDACLLDLGLPEINGVELAARLRSMPATAGSVLIAITGYGQEADRKKNGRRRLCASLRQAGGQHPPGASAGYAHQSLTGRAVAALASPGIWSKTC